MKFNRFNSPEGIQRGGSETADLEGKELARHFVSNESDMYRMENYLEKYASRSSQNDEIVYDSRSLLRDLDSKFSPNQEDKRHVNRGTS